MPEISNEGANAVYRSNCVELYFKCWVFLLKTIVYIDHLRELRDCPWEPTYSEKENGKIVEVEPILDIVGNPTLWPSFCNDDNFQEIFFQLKFLWEAHCNNPKFEIFRIKEGELGLRARKKSNEKCVISLQTMRASLWMVSQALPIEVVFLLFHSGLHSAIKVEKEIISIGWGPLYFADSPIDLSLSEDSEEQAKSDLDFSSKIVSKDTNEKLENDFIPFIPDYQNKINQDNYFRSGDFMRTGNKSNPSNGKRFRGICLISPIVKRNFKSLEVVLVNYYPFIHSWQFLISQNMEKPIVKQCLDNLIGNIEEAINPTKQSLVIVNEEVRELINEIVKDDDDGDDEIAKIIKQLAEARKRKKDKERVTVETNMDPSDLSEVSKKAKFEVKSAVNETKPLVDVGSVDEEFHYEGEIEV